MNSFQHLVLWAKIKNAKTTHFVHNKIPNKNLNCRAGVIHAWGEYDQGYLATYLP